MADETKKGDRGREPQSYGSEKDWLTGNTGGSVDRTQSKSDRHDEAFYEPRHLDENSPGDRGGLVSDVQLQYGADAPGGRAEDGPSENGWKVSDSASGRSSYFRKRDYE